MFHEINVHCRCLVSFGCRIFWLMNFSRCLADFRMHERREEGLLQKRQDQSGEEESYNIQRELYVDGEERDEMEL